MGDRAVAGEAGAGAVTVVPRVLPDERAGAARRAAGRPERVEAAGVLGKGAVPGAVALEVGGGGIGGGGGSQEQKTEQRQNAAASAPHRGPSFCLSTETF